MSDWISGRELEKKGIKGFDLFGCATRRVLQPHDRETGDPVYPPNKSILIRQIQDKKKDLRKLRETHPFCSSNLEDIDKHYYYERGSRAFVPKSIVSRCWQLESEIQSLDDELNILSEGSNTYSWKDYRPESQEEKKQAIALLLDCIYRVEECEKAGLLRGEVDDTPEAKGSPSDDVETFIKSLRISLESDSQIKIQLPGKPPVPIDCKALGFRNEHTKAWKALHKILESDDHTFKLGDMSRIDADRKRLDEISKKIVTYVNHQFKMNIPENEKLFELTRNGRTGTYRPKFQMAQEKEDFLIQKYNALPKEKLLAKLRKSIEEYKKTELSTVFDKANRLANIAIQKGWITNEEATDMIYPER